MQAQSAGGAPDPDRITTRPQLAAALATVKGDRSYRQLRVASERLIADASARRVGTDGGRGWRAELLTKGSVSDWLYDRSLPRPNKLVTFLAVCGFPREEWPSWIEAVGRARQAAPGRTITDHDPLLLGVHSAIHPSSDGTADGGDLDRLTPYVFRDHDQKLRACLRGGRGHQMVVLVGGSSVGKTRACFEAVREVLPGWPVVHPTTAEELLTVLDGVAGTVLWLDETQRYLHSRDVAIALRRVLSSPARTAADRVVIVGSMWLDPYWQIFTRQPQHDEPDIHAEVRDLLTKLGVRINVAEDFSRITSEQLADLNQRVEEDPRLATAVAACGEQLRIIQTLAGGPLLLNHYIDLAGKPAHAVLTAAMDARRIGYSAPITAALLEHAAPGYLTPEQRATTAGWLTTALKVAAQEIRGVRALIPIRTDETIDEADGYVLHDFLAQHAIGDRRREPIPTSLWNAVTKCLTELNDLRRVGQNAHLRRLLNYAIPIYRTLTDAGDEFVAWPLAKLLSERGDQAAVTELRTRAAAGDNSAAYWLAELLLAEQGDDAALAELRAQLNAGTRGAAEQLAELLARQGDEAALAELRSRADTGDWHAANQLAALLTEEGDWQSAAEIWRARVDTGDRQAAIQLAALQAEQGDEAALTELRARANAGDSFADSLLARLLARRGDRQGEVKMWRARAADTGDELAAIRLAELLAV